MMAIIPTLREGNIANHVNSDPIVWYNLVQLNYSVYTEAEFCS